MEDVPELKAATASPVRPPGGADEPVANRILAFRRLRDRQLGSDLFGEPAWEILLALFCASDRRFTLSMEDLAAEVSCNPSSLMRWLSLMEKRGLVEQGSAGKPQQYRLSAAAYEAVDKVCRSA